MTLRILAVGDIHLGKRPGSVPPSIASSRDELDALGPRGAWRSTVRAALDHRVDAVLLLGDVVEDEERYSEAWAALKEGLSQLLAAGIEVVAIAGNHDVRVLPRLAATLGGLRLVGQGGRWEAIELAGGKARILGWSYPIAHVNTDPTKSEALAELCRERGAGPTLGLLHGDLDASRSDFARFARSRLEAYDVDAWLLGHVHKPSFARAGAGRKFIGYLGSLTGLDPGEPGVHGPWLLTFEGRALVEAVHLPLAPLRFERIELDVGGWTSIEDFQVAVTGASAEFDERESSRLEAVRAVGLRITLVGDSRIHRELRAAVAEFDLEALTITLGDRRYFVDALIDDARPELDLAALSAASDPPGLLARRLLALEGAPLDEAKAAERAELLRLARAVRTKLAGRKEFVAVKRGEQEDKQLIVELRAAGYAALEGLLANRLDREARA